MDNSSKPKYVRVSEAIVPKGARWSQPLSDQGQMVERYYSTGNPRQRDESGPGDEWMMFVDRSGGPVEYYRLAKSDA